MTDTANASVVLVSLGYEGRSIASFLAVCQSAGVRTLVDVRLTPWSRKKGFSKTMLGAVLAARGIAYVHEPELGNPKENRDSFRNGDAAARALFGRLLDSSGTEAVQRIVSRAAGGPVAILCYERDESACHRQMVIGAVAGGVPAATVISIP